MGRVGCKLFSSETVPAMGCCSSRQHSAGYCGVCVHSEHCCLHRCFPRIPDVLSLVDLPAQPGSWICTHIHEASVQTALSAHTLNFPPVLIDTILSFLNPVPADSYRMCCHG